MEFAVKIEIPSLLSYMTYLDPNAYIPGIKDLVHGYTNPYTEKVEISYFEKMERGKELSPHYEITRMLYCGRIMRRFRSIS